MKKWLIAAALAVVFLSGCGAQPTFETISDEISQQVAAPREIKVQLPSESAVLTMQNPEQGMLYECDGFTASIQRLPGGNLAGTLQEITGYTAEKLKPVETAEGIYHRYDFVCTVAGESGDEVCRGRLIDDGNYHYILMLTAQAEKVHDLEKTWQKIADSFVII